MAAAVNTATWFQRLCLLTLFLALAFVAVLVLWASNKGFEPSDESYYCLSAAYPHNNDLLNSYFGLITNRLCAGKSTLVPLRLWHFFYQLFALLLFAYTFLRHVSKRVYVSRAAQLVAGCTIIVTGFFNYDYLPMAMSYNSWSLILALFFCSCSLSISGNRRLPDNLLFVTMGGLGALLFYNKMPNGIALAGLFTLQLVLFARILLLRWVFYGTSGFILAGLVLFGSFSAVVEKTGSLIHNLFAVRGSSVGEYGAHIDEFMGAGPGFRIVLAGVLLVAIVFLLRRLHAPSWLGCFLIAGNLLFCFRFSGGNGAGLSNDYAMIFVVTASVVSTCLLFRDDLTPVSRESSFLVLFLYLLPFLLAAGTSNVIFYTASQAGVFAVAALIYCLLLIKGMWPRLLLCSVAIVLGANVCLVLFNGLLTAPYRQSDLRGKSVPLMFSAAHNHVLESPERYITLAALTLKLKKWNRENRAVLASPPCLGSIVLAGMRPRAVYWIADPERYAAVNRYYFPKMRPDTLPFLLLSEEIMRSNVQLAHLKSGRMDVVRDYKVCDSIYLPLNSKYFYFCKPRH